MTKTELEEKIKNGESVWCVRGKKIERIKFKDNIPYFDNYKVENKIKDENGIHYEYYAIKDLYKTKAEAEHYLHHANVTRTETLPFLTWEEFLSEEGISFISAEGFKCCLFYVELDDIIYLDKGYEIDTYDATKANFYKAYDECVRLFKNE